MINPKELRIGNNVIVTNKNLVPDYYGKIISVESIAEEGVNFKERNYEEGIDYEFAIENISGIELTPEILEKCGISIQRTHPNAAILYKGVRINNLNLFYLRNIDDSDKIEVLINSTKQIRYLHQFQNAMYFLTGEELTYTP